MIRKKGGLGRGLDALLGASAAARGEPALEPDVAETLRSLPVESIERGRYQPRQDLREDTLRELAESIRAQGVVQPVLVRPLGDGRYELIAGERRLRASLLAGRETVPCVVRQVGDKEMAEIALIENLQREDLHYFEEAAGYEKLLTQFDLTQEVLAVRVGKNQSTIANKLRLLKLSPQVREYIFKENLFFTVFPYHNVL